MFKANRKLTVSITTGSPETTFKEFDRVYLEKGAVTYVTKELKPELVRIELTTDQYELLVKSSTEIETYDYDRSKVAKHRLYVKPLTRAEKIAKLKKEQCKEKTKFSKTPTSYKANIEPHLENIEKMTHDGVSRKKIAMMLGLSYSSINQYMIRYKELKDALTKI